MRVGSLDGVSCVRVAKVREAGTHHVHDGNHRSIELAVIRHIFFELRVRLLDPGDILFISFLDKLFDTAPILDKELIRRLRVWILSNVPIRDKHGFHFMTQAIGQFLRARFQ